jgi:hypothetical protein
MSGLTRMVSMFEPQRGPSLVAKALTICAIGMGVGFGTCGLTFLTSGARGRVSAFIAGAGAFLFFSSLAGALITVLAYFGKLIVKSFRK